MRTLNLSNDYFIFIPESSLAMDIKHNPSNSIGEQAWCIIGARESYLKALQKGVWDGFSCSLTDHRDKKMVLSKLEETAVNLRTFFQKAKAENLNLNLLMDLLEHEVQHHGQLIRYTYANGLGFPESWKKRYTV